ncbi:Rha family transcriptional regulator [Streptococcus sp. IsoGale021]|uniref:Rha family transcriptional regulator n=1 Tax=Streptococcus TaxID=1301 RepID=UPI00200148A6|nr:MULTISPECIES: Rha family transcriptional regulator [Streptococcus]MCY7209872.1 Rha family transcriptional regulator [Streptococcus anginosus]MCY7211375.1 Rha family transcriptional regulator [Streptococcus anginosus]MCY7226503.1 Rha family transcriptional regulator [Streptococcus anginosus]MDQ8693939.1 Rha family transcriptional regulator [Streptococcus sp. IsoGale021]MDU5128284.1 Rha family transcriptional regulator [Streptococcus anginosus]
MELVYMDGKREPYTTSEIVAECAGVQHHTVTRLLRNHKERFEAFGFYGFEIHKLDGKGRPKKVYHLNEQQATLLITYLDNTPQVVKFKTNLVKAFFETRDEVAEFKLQRALEQPKRKSLHEAIEHWEQAPKHAHPTLNNLLLKGASGMNKRQLMAARGGYNGIVSLTSTELARYQDLEDMAIAMIKLGMTYQEIKSMVFRPQQGG